MINMEQAIRDKYPGIKDKPGYRLFFKIVKTITNEDKINDFIETNQHLRGFSFLDKILEYFNFSYNISNQSLNHIPAEGRVIIVANHPIGSLDRLALLKLIHSVRSDVKIVANDLLCQVEPLKNLFLPLDNLSEINYKEQYKLMLSCLMNEEALIIFPAGEVSRISPKGVKDGKWKSGFLKLASKTRAPILPILVDAKNSAVFYSFSAVYKPLGSMMLPHEMFNKENKEINFHIGKPVPYSAIESLDLGQNKLAKRFRKHIYRLNKNNKHKKAQLFQTIETIAHPIDRKALKLALYSSPLLGETNDGKKIFLYDYDADSPVMHEIGRLRELTFRSVEEGTGLRMDLDKYDSYYRHLVLWDENDLEIVGAYRLGECQSIVEKAGIKGLYTSSLFYFNQEMNEYLPHAIELGRSFVQTRYWGRRSLDYLWYGIGAYLRNNPQIKYLFGPVSLSDAYPEEARQLIIAFYKQQFGSLQHLAYARRPYPLNNKNDELFCSNSQDDYKAQFKKLNTLLEALNVKVPPLYKQYSELCDDKGCHFIDYSTDPDFNNCVDSLILVSLDKVKTKKAERYIGNKERERRLT